MKLFLSRLIPIVMLATWAAPVSVLADDDDAKTPFRPDAFLEKAAVGPAGEGVWVVPTTQLVKPAGKTILVPGRPVAMALSPDGKLLAVKGSKELTLFDAQTREVRQSLAIKQGSGFCGVAWSADGSTVWLTTSKNRLLGASLKKGANYAWTNEIVLPGAFLRKDGSFRRYDQGVPLPVSPDKDSAPGGFAFDGEGKLAYVALSLNDSLGIVDLAAKKVIAEIPVGVAPYDVRLVGGKAYVTNWGGRRPQKGDLTGPTGGSAAVINPAGIASTGTVSVIDLASRKVVREIPVMLHPSAMALAPGGGRLYVANANSDTISVIDTARDEVTATWSAQPMPRLPLGSAPTALALSPDGQRLYTTLGGNNCVAVLETKGGTLEGLIPTGWYPGDLCLAGETLCVANTKGVGGRLRDLSVAEKKKAKGYTSHQQLGSVSFIDVPGAEQLQRYTVEVGANMRLPRLAAMMKAAPAERRIVPVPTRPGEVSAIKHVIYIIKENRTYDQVFGDMKKGKGDASLCQFGSQVTPNHHALAEEFVLLDNFYCNGVLSADGHQWTDEGMVTDYLEKSFGGFTRSYPYEGDDAMGFVASGFIWDHVLRAGLTFRDYGEMVTSKVAGRASWKTLYQDYQTGRHTVQVNVKTAVHGLEPYICPGFPGFPLTVPDVYRAQLFLKEFAQFEAKGEMPNFIIMLLPGDHTSGTRPGVPTPRAQVADNDLALGQIVEAVSKSRFWSETAIFAVEDDPQAGLDHIDGHRTVALCVSPYTRQGKVDSSHYSQTGMLRTIELILGVGPLTQLTMAANPMVNCFMDKADMTPYRCRPNNIPLDEMNPPLAALKGQQAEDARVSIALPLEEPDKCDEMTLNRILWHSVKGYDVPYPEIKTRLTTGVPSERDED